ncbi:MAG: GIY-YIG nuclease family protein [Planctomycetota bacterium]
MLKNAKEADGTTYYGVYVQDVRDDQLPALHTADEVAAKFDGFLTAARLTELADAGYAPCWRIDAGPPLFRLPDIRRYIRLALCEIQPGVEFPTNIAVFDMESEEHRYDSRKWVGLPPALHMMREHLRHFQPEFYPGCVYFLCLDRRVVYVGRAEYLPKRIIDHRNGTSATIRKKFDAVYYLACPYEDQGTVEGAFIRVLRPPLNRSHKAAAGKDEWEVVETFGLGPFQ